MRASAGLIKILKASGVETILRCPAIRLCHFLMPVLMRVSALSMSVMKPQRSTWQKHMPALPVASGRHGYRWCRSLQCNCPFVHRDAIANAGSLLSGDSEASLDNRGSFQEMDQVQITRAVTKFSQRICQTSELELITNAEIAPAFERAFASGKPACINVRIRGFGAPTFANE